MVRIAMVTSSVSRRGAGLAAAVEGLSHHVSRQGAMVRVFAPAEPDADIADWKGADVILSPVVGPAALGYAPRMLHEILAFGPCAVHLHGLWMHPSRTALQWARRTGRPYMISPHGMLAPAALAYSRGKKRIARLLFQDRVFAGAGAYHATSDEEALQIRAFGVTQPVETIPNGTDLRPVLKSADRRASVLSLGRIHPVKGLDLLVRAWARVAPSHPGYTLDIVGPDEAGHRGELEALARTVGAQRIAFHGPLYGEAKYRRFADAAVFVLPSHTENFGLTVVESLMMETPVIATTGTPWAGLERQGCGLWVPADESAFADALTQMLALNEGQRHAMGAAGRRWVEETFTWPRVADAALAAYERLVWQA